LYLANLSSTFFLCGGHHWQGIHNCRFKQYILQHKINELKNFNIVLVAVFTLISTGALAQNNNNRSKKEQMKMEVVKMKTTPAKITNDVSASNRSAKEQMKTDLMRTSSTEKSHELVTDNSLICSNQLTHSNRSPKEQMKLKVVKQNKCVDAGDIAAVKDGKCTNCGKNASTLKK